MSKTHEAEWLTVTQVAQRFGVSSATVWRWAREHQFPEPVRIGPRSTRWRLADVQRHETKLADVA